MIPTDKYQIYIKMSKQVANRAKRQRTTKYEKESKSNAVLPAEVFDLIIAHLDVNDRITCRAVCQYFRQMVNKIKIRSLAIAESEDSICEPVLDVWEDDYDYNDAVEYKRFSDRFYFVSNEPVYESDTLITQDTCAGLRTLANCFDLSELRRLFIVKVGDGQTHFAFLNRLVQLEHLQISSIDLNCNLQLQLPNLGSLSIALVNHRDNFRISLATPRLRNFETENLTSSLFRFKYPKSVTLLQVRYIENDRYLYELKNLEILICEYGYQLTWFEEGDHNEENLISLNFAAFRKLKRLDCGRMIRAEAYRLFDICQANSIDFYYCGLKINDLYGDLDYLLNYADRRELLKLLSVDHMFEEYDQLADALYYCEGIRYFKYFHIHFPNKLPENFASKFYGIREVYVARKIENVDYFVQFLKCFKNLKVLWLENSFLTQEFFDRHSHLFARLHEFLYKHSTILNGPIQPIDLKFIRNFKYLESFQTDIQIGMDLITEAFNSLNYLKKFHLESFPDFLDLNFRITKTENEFRVHCFNRPKSLRIPKFQTKLKMFNFLKKRFPALTTREAAIS